MVSLNSVLAEATTPCRDVVSLILAALAAALVVDVPPMATSLILTPSVSSKSTSVTVLPVTTPFLTVLNPNRVKSVPTPVSPR